MNDNADDTLQEEIRDTLTPFEAYDAIPLCPTCFKEAEESWDFCPDCNAPLGFFVGYDPLKRVYVMRFLIYQGVTRPTHLLIVLGLWLFYIETALPPILASYDLDAFAVDIMTFVILGLLLVALSIWTLYLATRNAIRLHKNVYADEQQEEES